jgi:predicted TIM-barrel fold metal-dependent hydrolase
VSDSRNEGELILDSSLRVNFPPDPNPKKPRFALPAGSCDSHFHVYGPPNIFPFTDKRRYTPPAAPVEHYLQVADLLGLQRGVMVQPNVHGFDTAITKDAVEKSSGRLFGMIRADPKLSPEQYRELHQAGVRGIRFNIAHHLGDSFDEEQFFRTVAKVEPLGWPIDLHLDADQLEARGEMIRKVQLPVIIDHMARVRAERGLDHPHCRTLLDIAGLSHVYVKLSGANRIIARGATYQQVLPIAKALVARAPDRMIWGTDWPHSDVFEPGKMPNDGDLVDMLLDYAPDEGVRKRILVDNPARLFGFK